MIWDYTRAQFMGANNGLDLSSVNKYLVLGALCAGLVSGVSGITSDTSDRYKGAQAARDHAAQRAEIEKDFALRDVEIEHLKESLANLRTEFERTDHPPKRVDDALTDHEERIRLNERSVLMHHRDGHDGQ